MLLAVDVGNTNITLGAFDGGSPLGSWRLRTDPDRTADEYGADLLNVLRHALPGRSPSAVIYGSVVPRLDRVLEGVFERYLGRRALKVTPESPLGIKLKVRTPGEVGADRLLNALAVHRLFGGPAVVLDFGTATTFDCLSARGEYLGGAILPGPRLAARALSIGTAKLPEVEILPPRRAIGRDTVECIQAGLYYGYLGMIERVLRETLAEMGGRRVQVVATGGLAGLFADALPRVRRVAPDLTLQGLRLAYEILSRPQGGRRTQAQRLSKGPKRRAPTGAQ